MMRSDRISRSVSVTREDGASAAEYAILISAIAVIILAAIAFLGNASQDNFEAACVEFSNSSGEEANCE